MSRPGADVTLVREREALVAALRERGVDYLAPSDARGEPVADEPLIANLAAHDDPRLRQALIALFMLHPDIAPLVPPLRARLAPPAEVELLAHYMAAVYLQSMWRIRLNHYWPPTPDLPDYFSGELGLPDALELYGKAGLYALADWHSAHAPGRANHLSEYEGVAELLLDELALKARPAWSGRARFDVFLRELGERWRQPARLYLVGGTSSADEVFRKQTLDVDIVIEAPAGERVALIQVIREIRDRLGLNINEGSPADFIPLPAGYESRHEYIGRFGPVEVFRFDCYSTALGKIARCRRQDLADIVGELRHRLIEWGQLASIYGDSLPLMRQARLEPDIQEFALNFAELGRLWHSAGGTR